LPPREPSRVEPKEAQQFMPSLREERQTGARGRPQSCPLSLAGATRAIRPSRRSLSGAHSDGPTSRPPSRMAAPRTAREAGSLAVVARPIIRYVARVELPELTGYTDDGELLRLWARVMSALHDRGVIRSANNPVGDLCDGLVAKHFGVAVETQSTKGYDVFVDGVRYQVKGRRTTPRSKPSHYSPIRNIDAHEFDFVLAVHLDEDFEVTDAWKSPITRLSA
jgi:hypothetical protein